MKRLFSSLLLLILVFPESIGQISLKKTEPARNLSPTLIGYNGRSTEGPSWENTAFLSMVENLNPGMVRYPAGTQANYWDWRTGAFIEGSGKTSSYTFTIPMLVEGLPQESDIIYVMNMARPTPATGISLDASASVLKSDATLQKKIEDMLAALSEFENSGRLPEAVELGNEFYFSNEHAAIYAANPDLYLQHSKTICKAIKAVYPGLKILLITTKGGTSGRDSWNEAVFSTLAVDSEFSEMVAGVVQHHYINENYGDPTTVSDLQTAKIAMAEGFHYTRESLSDYNLVPQDQKLWITEYGATKPNADGTWASGLRAVAMTMGWIELGEKIQQLCYHHITNDPDVINKDKMKLGPAGMTLGLLGAASREKTQVQGVDFSNNPAIGSSVETLHGFLFKNESEESLFLLNLGEEGHIGIDIEGILDYDSNREIMQYWSEQPYQSSVYRGKGVNEESKKVATTVDLKPFSVSLITASQITGFNESQHQKGIKIYPTVIETFFTVELPSGIHEANISIIDISGRVCYQKQVNESATQHSPKLIPGWYLVNVTGGTGSFTGRVLCK